MIGKMLGTYEIREVIGSGGMADIYKAYDAHTGRYVAIKVLPDQFSKDATFRERFRREARAIATLEHIHILPVFAYGEDEDSGAAYLVMRLLETGSLADRVQAGPLSLSETERIVTQVAAALDHAHQRGIIHRDVKPSNVLLDSSGNAFLTDFGIAKISSGITTSLTATGAALGTPMYMSPEQVQSQPVDARSDVYSLAVVTYHMLSGNLPFQAETPLAMAFKHVSEPPPMLSHTIPDIPVSVATVVHQAMSKNPDQRPDTAGEFARLLSEAIARASDEEHLTERMTGVASPLSPHETLPMEAEDASATIPTPSMTPAPAPAARPIVAMPPVTPPPPAREPKRRRSGLMVVLGVLLGGLALAAVGLGGAVALGILGQGANDTSGQSTLGLTPFAPSDGNVSFGLLLQDTFDDPDSGFPVLSDETGGINYEDGSLVIDVVGGGVEWYAPTRRVDAADVRVEVDATLRSGAIENEYGSLCRWQDRSNFYAFVISSDGQYAIWKVVDDALTVLVDWTPSDVIQQDAGPTNHIEAVCEGFNLSLSANGTLLATISDGSLARGDVGLVAGLFGDGRTTVGFDDLIVAQP